MEKKKTQNIDKGLLDKYTRKSGKGITYLSEKLGISISKLNDKMNGKIPFLTSEVYVICEELQIPDADANKIFYP